MAEDRIEHGWNCSRPPAEEYHVIVKATGTARVIKRCPACLAVESKVRGWPFPPSPPDAAA